MAILLLWHRYFLAFLYALFQTVRNGRNLVFSFAYMMNAKKISRSKIVQATSRCENKADAKTRLSERC